MPGRGIGGPGRGPGEVDRDAGSVDRDRVWDVPQLFVGTAGCAGVCAAG